MSFVAFDAETHRITPGCAAPRLVVGSFWSPQSDPGELKLRPDALRYLEQVLESGDLLVGANLAYDLIVACAEEPRFVSLCFDLFDAGRARDVLIAQKMRDLATGGLDWITVNGIRQRASYSLAGVVKRHLGLDRTEDKKDPNAPRLNYHRVDGLPLEQWPPRYRNYALQDAEDTGRVFLAQGDPLPDELRQIRYQWALSLMGAWGLRTEAKRVAALRDELEVDLARKFAGLQDLGFFRADGTRDMSVIRELVAKCYDGNPPKTPHGAVSTEAETLEESGNLSLITLADWMTTAKLLSKDIPQLESSTVVPLCPRWNGLVETGRTSVSPNVQNPPRKGGVRECHVPRPGFVFVSTDLDTIELRALAQACLSLLGWSTMADALRRGEDLHSALGAEILGISYQEFCTRLAAGDKECDEHRQFAKIPNFGLPGGMGANSLMDWAKGAGVKISLDFAKTLIAAWHRKWPEMKDYFKIINSITGGMGDCRVTQLFSGRVRAGVSYCSAANTYFQGLTADGAKSALSSISQACYIDRMSPLYGSRPVMFIHDEIISEVREHLLHQAAMEQQRILVQEVQSWIPDVPVSSTPVAMRRWYKGAKPVYVNGLLVPSRPEKLENKTLWVADV